MANVLDTSRALIATYYLQPLSKDNIARNSLRGILFPALWCLAEISLYSGRKSLFAFLCSSYGDICSGFFLNRCKHSFFVFPRPRFIAQLFWILISRVCRPCRACTNLAHRIRWSIILCMNHAEPGHRTPTIHTVQHTHATAQCAHTASIHLPRIISSVIAIRVSS